MDYKEIDRFACGLNDHLHQTLAHLVDEEENQDHRLLRAVGEVLTSWHEQVYERLEAVSPPCKGVVHCRMVGGPHDGKTLTLGDVQVGEPVLAHDLDHPPCVYLPDGTDADGVVLYRAEAAV